MNIKDRDKCNLVYRPPYYDCYIKTYKRNRSNIKDVYQDLNNNLINYKKKETIQISLSHLENLIKK